MSVGYSSSTDRCSATTYFAWTGEYYSRTSCASPALVCCCCLAVSNVPGHCLASAYLVVSTDPPQAGCVRDAEPAAARFRHQPGETPFAVLAPVVVPSARCVCISTLSGPFGLGASVDAFGPNTHHLLTALRTLNRVCSPPCCAVLCRAVPCCAVLCCAVLCCEQGVYGVGRCCCCGRCCRL